MEQMIKESKKSNPKHINTLIEASIVKSELQELLEEVGGNNEHI